MWQKYWISNNSLYLVQLVNEKNLPGFNEMQNVNPLDFVKYWKLFCNFYLIFPPQAQQDWSSTGQGQDCTSWFSGGTLTFLLMNREGEARGPLDSRLPLHCTFPSFPISFCENYFSQVLGILFVFTLTPSLLLMVLISALD